MLFSKLATALIAVGAMYLFGHAHATVIEVIPLCFDDWGELRDAMASAPDDGTPTDRAFTICPGAVLDVSGGAITIDDQAKITIRCGGDNCVFNGGARQLNIIGKQAILYGLTFKGANEGSIRVETDIPGPGIPPDTVFENCIFEDNDSSGNANFPAVASVHHGGRVRFESW